MRDRHYPPLLRSEEQTKDRAELGNGMGEDMDWNALSSSHFLFWYHKWSVGKGQARVTPPAFAFTHWWRRTKNPTWSAIALQVPFSNCVPVMEKSLRSLGCLKGSKGQNESLCCAWMHEERARFHSWHLQVEWKIPVGSPEEPLLVSSDNATLDGPTIDTELSGHIPLSPSLLPLKHLTSGPGEFEDHRSRL